MMSSRFAVFAFLVLPLVGILMFCIRFGCADGASDDEVSSKEKEELTFKNKERERSFDALDIKTSEGKISLRDMSHLKVKVAPKIYGEGGAKVELELSDNVTGLWSFKVWSNRGDPLWRINCAGAAPAEVILGILPSGENATVPSTPSQIYPRGALVKGYIKFESGVVYVGKIEFTYSAKMAPLFGGNGTSYFAFKLTEREGGEVILEAVNEIQRRSLGQPKWFGEQPINLRIN